VKNVLAHMVENPKENILKNFLKKVPKMGVNFSYI
jgi:hypothetical protein